MKGLMGLALAAALLGGVARAEVTDKSAAGFEVTEKATIAAPPSKVWDSLMHPARWWASDHTWSGDAKNLSFDPSGCFCETLKKGGVRHMMVIYADGATALRLSGGLGPLQFTGASGVLGFALKDAGAGKTDLVVTYDVGGYAKGGLAETYAAPVDKVLSEQVARLKKAVETGKPN
ncbi:MAG TPA: SRPBCC family protein [Phenylobacterium sp.]|nr:SRPBCC family protein [Phenylobacterium sp.]